MGRRRGHRRPWGLGRKPAPAGTRPPGARASAHARMRFAVGQPGAGTPDPDAAQACNPRAPLPRRRERAPRAFPRSRAGWYLSARLRRYWHRAPSVIARGRLEDVPARCRSGPLAPRRGERVRERGSRPASGRPHAALVATLRVADDVRRLAVGRQRITRDRAARAERAIAVRTSREPRATPQRRARTVARVLEHRMAVRPRVTFLERRGVRARNAAATRAPASTSSRSSTLPTGAALSAGAAATTGAASSAGAARRALKAIGCADAPGWGRTEALTWPGTSRPRGADPGPRLAGRGPRQVAAHAGDAAAAVEERTRAATAGGAGDAGGCTARSCDAAAVSARPGTGSAGARTAAGRGAGGERERRQDGEAGDSRGSAHRSMVPGIAEAVSQDVDPYHFINCVTCTRFPQPSPTIAIFDPVTSVGGCVNSAPRAFMRS